MSPINANRCIYIKNEISITCAAMIGQSSIRPELDTSLQLAALPIHPFIAIQ